jgi:hypothetical protein
MNATRCACDFLLELTHPHASKSRIQFIPKFCNEKRTATKEYLKIAGFIFSIHAPETTKQVVQDQEMSNGLKSDQRIQDQIRWSLFNPLEK